MKAPIADIIIKMIDCSRGDLHDIDHFLKVYAYAKAIGEKELSDEMSKDVLEAAAVLHDIACPICREKYGKAEGRMQEIEGGPLAREFLAGFCLPEDFVDRVVWLVAHHHTYSGVNSPEHRILLEADYLVNAGEGGHSKEQILSAREGFFRTETGTSLLDSIYLISV